MEEKSRSGILNLACQNPDSIAKRLFEHGIVISVRGGGLRISPHFYNTEEEIHKLLSVLNTL
jgi:selenocysteine lyase/cysteine desulfurase